MVKMWHKRRESSWMDRFWGENGFQYQLNGPLFQFVYPIWGVSKCGVVCAVTAHCLGDSYEFSRFR